MKRNYADKQYKIYREAVLARDKSRCRMPGCNSKIRPQVHHIIRWADAPGMRYDPKNGITLCKKCHESIKGFEQNYALMFTKIINDSY